MELLQAVWQVGRAAAGRFTADDAEAQEVADRVLEVYEDAVLDKKTISKPLSWAAVVAARFARSSRTRTRGSILTSPVQARGCRPHDGLVWMKWSERWAHGSIS